MKILRVVADKKKKMTWKKTSPCISTPSPQSTCQNVNSNSIKSHQKSTAICGKSSGHASTKLTHNNKNTTLVSNSISSASSLLKKGGSGLPPEEHLSPLNPGVSSTANNVNGAGTYLIPSVTIHRVKKGKEFFYCSLLQIKLYFSREGLHITSLSLHSFLCSYNFSLNSVHKFLFSNEKNTSAVAVLFYGIPTTAGWIIIARGKFGERMKANCMLLSSFIRNFVFLHILRKGIICTEERHISKAKP